MYYYIYLIKFETGEIYIGSRQSKIPPEQDTKYWGSPVTYKHFWENTNLKKEKFIIKECKNVEELREIEPKLIRAGWEKYGDKCLNRTTNKRFHPEVSEKGRISVQNKYSKKYILKSPKGEIISGKNINKFCRENNLSVESLVRVINGQRKSYKGWKLPETENVNRECVAEKLSKEFILKSPTGEIIRGKNIRKFSRENNLCSSCICAILNNKRKSHKGWSLP